MQTRLKNKIQDHLYSLFLLSPVTVSIALNYQEIRISYAPSCSFLHVKLKIQIFICAHNYQRDREFAHNMFQQALIVQQVIILLKNTDGNELILTLFAVITVDNNKVNTVKTTKTLCMQF